MSGGGELAAVFQARRISSSGGVTTKKVEEVIAEPTIVSSSSSGELAAILQARQKKINGEDTTTTTPPRPSAAEATTTPLSPSAVLSPSTVLSTPANRTKNVPKYPQPSPTTASQPTVTTPTPTATTAKMAMASPVRNKTLTAKFESRDLEVGIPTPGFLQDAKKKLKKPGEKNKVASTSLAIVASPSVATAAAGDIGGATTEESKETTTVTVVAAQVQEQRDEGEGGQASSSSTSSTKTSRDQSHQDLMAARRSRMVASRSANRSEGNNVGGGTPTNKKMTFGGNNTVSAGTPTNNNNNNKAVKSKSLSINTTSTPTSNQKTTPATPTTPASVRREKLRARVRASSSSASSPFLKQKLSSPHGNNPKKVELDNLQTDVSPDEASSPSKICISSPTKDEFELSFFDVNNPANNPGPTLPDLDSNSNDQYQHQKNNTFQTHHFELKTDSSIDSIYKDLHASSTGSTLKTANNSSTASNCFRDSQRANTPKICGSQHSVYDLKGVYETSLARPESMHYRESSQGSSDQFNHLQPYAVTRSPSQGSQMSAITTPSCFPQENAMFPSLNGRNNEPTILEAINSFGNSASASTTKSGSEEMIHLREQMKEFKKKLEEKDAIISQLMKRISDLEQGHSIVGNKLSVGGGGGFQQQQQPPPRSSFGMDESTSAFSNPKNVGRVPFNNLASQSVQSIVRSTERKKFVC